MAHVTVRMKVVRDNTGIVSEIPVILTEFGPLMSLVTYVLERVHVSSMSSITKLMQAVGLLLDYVEANHDCYENAKELFAGFVQRLYTGTVGNDGQDPSGLYWNGRSPQVVRMMTMQLSAFSDWMSRRQGTKPLNPWRQATRAEERLAWAAWHQKRNRVFLAHTWDPDTASLKMTEARNALLNKTPVIHHDKGKRFPQDRLQELLFRGFIVPGKQKSPRIEERLNLRDILITLLLDCGGLRMSEPFHLYVHDVLPDPLDSKRAWVRVFHPTIGTAPRDWLDAKGKPIRCNRGAYLRGKWGMMPRTEYPSAHQWHAGWKGNALDSTAHFMDVNWFPTWAGELFWMLWVFYMAQRAQMTCNHPFAFVTLEGKPYGIDSFQRAHKRAVERIGLKAAKELGTSPHAHRHAYGKRLEGAKLDPIFIMKAMHHKSIESQITYTEPERVELARALEAATQGEQKCVTPPPPDFLTYGFRDVDPLGMMSGSKPKLRRRI